METYEDDDDTHFCIKCHLTVNGLDNYVRHRQSGCRPQDAKQETVHEPPMTPTTVVTYPEILNADAFFSSLELQSSSKSNSTVTRPRGLPDRKSGKSEDKRRKARKGQEHDDAVVKENLPPVVTDMDDLMDHLVIPSLVGFPEIVATTGNKSSTVVSGKTTCVASSSKVNNDDNLGDSMPETLMITGSKVSHETKRNPEWLEDGILGDLDTVAENKEAELTNYDEYDYERDEESEDSSLDDELEVDDESSSDDDYTEDHDYPRHSHTGGKWKPSELLQHQDTSRLNEDDEHEDDNNENPVAHTGGKWKPTDGNQFQRVEIEDEVSAKDSATSSLIPSTTNSRRELPAAGHTRGKWIPGVTAGDSASGYWCYPCGRKLASRLLYNRHLLSDLHARRSIQEIDGDSQLPQSVAASLLRRKSTSKRQRALAEIKSKRDIENLKENEEEEYDDDEEEKDDKKRSKKNTRRREKEILWCEMCHARVRRLQMGKHLLSHYHCRVAGTNPSSSTSSGSPAARRFILENMGNIVRQCPFQCASCRFYCNTEDTFMLHWRSKFHASRFDRADNYKCSACNFWCTENELMEQHLETPGHREIVAMMNGSVPVVVQRQKPLACETCNQHFRYNLQLRFHARKTGHRVSNTATDEYQSKIACGLCSQVVRSLVALQRHQLSCHTREEPNIEKKTKAAVQPSAPYFCSFCNLNFATARDAVLHRRTLKHKEIVKVQKVTAENIGSLERECPHCGAKQSRLSEHKAHLLDQHPELCHRCPRCGKLFALPQDVTRHSRGVDCLNTIVENSDIRPTTSSSNKDKEWRCGSCPFVTDSQAEFIFHEALHAGIVDESEDEAAAAAGGTASSGKPRAKYRCPMCEKSFAKGSLRNHIRNHTGERPFRCVKCSASFSSRSGLNAHRKECPGASSSSMRKENHYSRQRNHTCSECNTAFYTNHLSSRYVSYQEVYTKRFIFKKLATRINYRWEYYRDWSLQNECCPGYEPQGIQTSICRPTCQSGCHYGKCIEPNICSCDSGYRAIEMDGISRCVPHCPGNGVDGCGDNGSCIAPNICACHVGYSLTMSIIHGQITSSLPCIPKCSSPECGINSYCGLPEKCVCKDGYTRKETKISDLVTSTFTCVPSCVPKCGNNSKCLFPDKCVCDFGYSALSFDDNSRGNDCLPVCEPVCFHGTCTSPGHCECHQGYAISFSLPDTCSPICDPLCVNGICTRPGICECLPGYAASSNLTNSCSPICHPPCVNANCTRPGICECLPGYAASSNLTNSCSPICDPLCVNGICTRPGICECLPGYAASSNLTNSCSPICHPPCVNANCTRPGICECLPGYAASSNLTNSCSPICHPPCVNANCAAPGICDCHVGYRVTSEQSSQFCAPVCQPTCAINNICIAPNECTCADGYAPGATDVSNDTICTPVCDSCRENEICVAPKVCQCKPGYEELIVEVNITQCRPICQETCVNGYCDAPNRCTCFSGYEVHSLDHFLCQPICQNDCFNATCNLPNHCECYDGYEKTLSPSEAPGSYDNTCVPRCSGQCLNGTCVSPDRCVCNPGYILVNVTSLGSILTTAYPDNDNTTVNDTTQMCQPFCETLCPIGSECLSPNQCGPQLDDGHDSYEFTVNSTHRIDRLEDCGRNTDYLDADNGKCVCKYGWTGRLCEKSMICALLIATNCENEKSTTSRSIWQMANDTIEPNYEDNDARARMISRDDDASLTFDWNGPICMEECRDLMTSLEISQNRSDKTVTCYLVESENIMTGVLSIRERATLIGSTNDTLACFIDIDSPCNIAELQLIRKTYESLVGGIIGGLVILVLVAIGSTVYYRKKRPNTLAQAVSMSNSTLLIRPESTYSLHTTEDSSSLHSLRQHMLRHAGKSHKCGLPGCPTVLRTANELKSHRLLVHESVTSDRKFHCNDCSYSAKTKTQLRRHTKKHNIADNEENPKRLNCPYSSCNFTTNVTSHLTRHVRLHTGTKPYKCRHCKYASNNLENLRKHVLSTSLHPGKTIYECDTCQTIDNTNPYCTNFAKELRAHLLEAHQREFPTPSHASDHVAGIFGTENIRISPKIVQHVTR